MKTIATCNDLRVVERGGYWYVEGTGTIDNRNTIAGDINAKLSAISPDALDLARALVAIHPWRPAGYADAKRVACARMREMVDD